MIQTNPRAGSGDGSLLIILTEFGLDVPKIAQKARGVKQIVDLC